MKKTDRRVIRTRRLLGEALIDLSLEKGFDEISIFDITNRADIGYRTFFRHYKNKKALLYDVLEGILEDVLELMVPIPTYYSTNTDFVMIPAENITFLFQHAKENSNLYRVLLNSSSGMQKTIMDFACNAAEVNMERSPNSSVPSEIAAHHIVSSLITMIRWWLDNSMPYTPEQMGEYTNLLIMRPAIEALHKQK